MFLYRMYLVSCAAAAFIFAVFSFMQTGVEFDVRLLIFNSPAAECQLPGKG